MFNESEWIKLLFLLSDTQQWITEMEKDLFMQLPGHEKRKCFRKTYHITAAGFAHIIERHYNNIPRFPGAGKFTIPVADIMHCIRQAAHCEPKPLSGTLNFIREYRHPSPLGFDRAGAVTSIMTVITCPGGCIKTAFPGIMQ